jgi:hypothetical protein
MAEPQEDMTPEEEARQNDIDDAITALIKTQPGKLLIFYFLELCAIYEDAFIGEMEQATAYVLGRQSIGRRFIERLNSLDARHYPRLLLDVAELEETRRAVLRKNKENNEDEEDTD